MVRVAFDEDNRFELETLLRDSECAFDDDDDFCDEFDEELTFAEEDEEVEE